VNQIEWSPFGWSREMLDYCGRHGIAIQAYGALTRGRRLDNERLRSVAASHGRTPAQVLLAWSVQRGAIPLPKANRHDHLVENLEALDLELSRGDLDVLNSLNEEYSSLGSLPYA
jgi:diketogulonate reductase-like aldo/keto reductase